MAIKSIPFTWLPFIVLIHIVSAKIYVVLFILKLRHYPFIYYILENYI